MEVVKGIELMEINDLIIFKTVANEGSISKAAIELGYVQSNVTERIKKLEQELGTPLLYRYSRGVSLLPAGETLLNYTNKILHLVEEAKNEIKIEVEPYRVATSQSILSHYVSPRIQENFDRFQIYMESSLHLHQLIKNQKVDLVITYENYSDISLREAFRTTISMGLLKGKGKLNNSFAKERYFVSHDPQCPFRAKTIEFLAENNLSNKQLYQVDSYSLIKELVAQGKGIAFLPTKDDSLEEVKGVELKSIPIYFFTPRILGKEIPCELIN